MTSIAIESTVACLKAGAYPNPPLMVGFSAGEQRGILLGHTLSNVSDGEPSHCFLLEYFSDWRKR